MIDHDRETTDRTDDGPVEDGTMARLDDEESNG
jgi:hypothetical protein